MTWVKYIFLTLNFNEFIKKNQEKLDTILANQDQILSLLKK